MDSNPPAAILKGPALDLSRLAGQTVIGTDSGYSREGQATYRLNLEDLALSIECGDDLGSGYVRLERRDSESRPAELED